MTKRELYTKSFIFIFRVLSYDARAVYKEFYPPQCQSHFPFSGGHQTFVSDLLTCQKQHNLRTKCGIIYAEKETSDMKRDKKKKLTE